MNFSIKSPGKLFFFVILILWCTLSIKTVDADADKDPDTIYNIVSSNLCDPNVKQYSGYIKLNQTRSLFFWFFESRNNPKSSPLTLWLNGGPGCSSMTGLFQAIGPCKALVGGSDVEIRSESWNEVSNMLFVDQPVGSGFSFGDNSIMSTEQSSQDLYKFLQSFFEKFPEYSTMNFHIFGESYGGHYVPSVAKLINENNILIDSNNLNAIPINLQSIGIGNGWIDPKILYQSFPDFAEFNSYGPILNSSLIAEMRSQLPECERLADECNETENITDCSNAYTFCVNNVYSQFFNSELNPYDIRTPVETMFTYPSNDYTIYLDKVEVIAAIGAQKNYVNCSEDIYNRFTYYGDEIRTYKDEVEYLLDKGISVLIYNGDTDFICNWFGGRDLANALKWTFQSQFNNSTLKQWMVDNNPAGEIKSFDKLTFIRVYEAGHAVPAYQPKNSLEMFRKWINNEEFIKFKVKRKRRINKNKRRF